MYNYKIVQKSGAKPISVQEGTPVAITPGQTHEDKKPETGVPLYYAVFADDGGVTSLEGAILQKPVMLMRSAANVKVEIVGDLLKLSWQVPANTYSVLVMRKEGTAPISRTDGVRIPTQALTSLIERGAVNGRIYFYSVYSVCTRVQTEAS